MDSIFKKRLHLIYKTELIDHDHDGYCSGAEETERIQKPNKEYYISLTENFSELKNIMGKINLSSEILRPYIKISYGCNIGSGYCGLGLFGHLQSAEIVNGVSETNVLRISCGIVMANKEKKNV